MSDLPAPLEPHITVQDAVHGRIWLTQLEQTLVNSAEFQRLRHIGQLGLANFVFPSASHSRLAHSLGATHVMGWMLRQPTLQKHFKDREEFITLLRLAALLHDIGHYPFSHLGENVYGAVRLGGIQEYEADDVTVFDVAAAVRKHSEASHERLTAVVIKETRIADEINQNVGKIDGRDATDVLVDIIQGTYAEDTVCHSLLSSDLDCDRLDYLVRDSASAGLAYGTVDLGYLIENLRVEDHEKYGPMLAVDRDHGFGAVEHYLHARYFHYARFITHKTTASAELLLAAGILELIRTDRLPRDVDAIASSIGSPRFLAFTDERVWSVLHEVANDKTNKVLAEVASSLVNRTLLKCAWNIEALEEDREPPYEQIQLDKLLGTPERKRETASAAGVDPDSFCYKRASMRLSGVPARVTPNPEKQERYEWIETVNVARPGEQPEPAVLFGLLKELSTRMWVTRRVFVREPAFSAADKDCRERTSKLNAYLASQLARN